MSESYFSRPRPRLYGHRGAAGTAPENTMASFRQAIAAGVAYLELDVHASRDGVIMVIHDPTVDRTTDGTGAVREMSFAALCELDAGFRFEASDGTYPWRGKDVRLPSLAELVTALPEAALNIEIKQAAPPIEERVVSLLREHGAGARVMLAAEDHHIMERIRRADPGIPTSASAAEAREFFERCFADDFAAYRPAFRALQIPRRFEGIDLVTEDTIRTAHRLEIELHVWTINAPDEMDHLLRLDVDGVMSDFPRALVDVAARL